MPSIAGQPRVFLENLLVLTREGLRGAPAMQEILKGAKDREIVALAAHFAVLAPRAAPGRRDEALFARGRELAGRLRCGICHLADYRGQQQMPRLAGQREEYLRDTMVAMRDNPPPGVDTQMSAALYGVSDADIGAMSHFLARFDPAAPSPAGGESPVRLPELSVSATRVERENFAVPAAIDTVGRRAIREDNPRVDLSEALARVPGLVIQNRQNYAQDLQVSSRGFGARTSFGVRGLRLLADGIPATMPDGQGQAATFNLSSADRIEVLRGPFSVLHGNAAGGVIQVFTAEAPDEPTLSGQAFGGSDGMRKTGVQFGGTVGGLGALVDASRFSTDGYREHSAATRDHLNAKFRMGFGEAATLTVVANALDQPGTQDPLGLTAAQLASDRRQAGTNALAFDTRKNIRQSQLGLALDAALSPQLGLNARAYGGDRQVTQYLAIPLAAQASPTASGGVVDLDRGFAGAAIRLSRGVRLAGEPATLSVGADYDRMAERRTGRVNDAGVAGALKRDEDNVVDSRDAYVQLEWQPRERWSLLAGLRHSRVRFSTSDYFVAAGNPDDSGNLRFARTTPALGVVFKADPALNLYANYGRGFETPTFAELAYQPNGATGLNLALSPARSVHREAGLKARLGETGRVNAAVFRVDVDDEIVVAGSSGGRTIFANAARTRRQGFELAWEQRVGAFEAALAWTVVDARFAGAAPGAAAAAGNRLPGVPPSSLFAEVVWRPAGSGFHAGVEVRRSSQVFVNDANTEAAPGYCVWGLRAGLEQRGRGWRIAQFVRVENAGDRRYVGSVIVADANGRFYEPAPARRVVAGIEGALEF